MEKANSLRNFIMIDLQTQVNNITLEMSVVQYYQQTIDFYEGCADVYELLYPDHIAESQKLLLEVTKVFKSIDLNSVLDASCGIGTDMKVLHEAGFDVSGLDISSKMVMNTKHNFRHWFNKSPEIIKGDVKNIEELIPQNKFDAVLFRGNTFSNILPEEHILVLEKLLSVLRGGGVLCIDFRDGEEQFNEKKFFEFRGSGYNKNQKQVFMSYYYYHHPDSIVEPYEVEACINLLNYAISDVPIIYKIKIKSHYVVRRIFESYLDSKNIRYSYVNQYMGLPYLKTLLIYK